MAKKKFFLIVDTETTMDDTVADFGAAVCDIHGNIFHECGVLVKGHFGEKELFHDQNSSLWNLERRNTQYANMLNAGTRVLASVQAINNWLLKVKAKYDPELTAYNLAFDLGKCANTAIDLSIFQDRFCLWGAAVGNICETKKYREFALQNHLFNNRTKHGNMSMITNAECVSAFVNGCYIEEPHTALEDITGFEIPILAHIVKKRGWREKTKAYSWNHFQVNKLFKSV